MPTVKRIYDRAEFTGEVEVDTISESTNGAGVTVDGVKPKDTATQASTNATDISTLQDDKADKVSGATSNNLAGLDANGNLQDAGVSPTDISDNANAIGNHTSNTSNPHATDIANLGAGTLSELNTKVSDATLDDSSDPRTPTAHNTTHQSGGSDAIKLDDLASPDDNTDLNSTTSAHGLLPKLSGTATDVLNGTGAWAQVSTTDEHVKISSNDTTAGYLNGKLVAGTNVSLSENNDGGDETLAINVENATDTHAIHDNVADEITAITPKANPTLNDKILIEDSEDSSNKKSVNLGDLPFGGGGLTWKVITASQTVVAGEGYIIDNSSNAVTLTCLTSPSIEDMFGVKVFDTSSNAITIDGNSAIVEGSTDPFEIDVDNSGFTMIYSGASNGWVIASEIGNGVDNYLHTDVAGEISVITEKTSLVDNDLILIEDSADGYTKKRITAQTLKTYITS